MAAMVEMQPLINDSAWVDGLTRLWNRAYRDLHLPAQLALARQNAKPVGCIMADIDGLESINRRFGQAVGNDVVRLAAQILASQCRVEDMLCYLGNGKFSLVLSATLQAGAARLANRARMQIEYTLTALGQDSVHATCSFGVADTRYGSDESLLDRADAALLCAKRSGKNCISLSPPVLVKRPAAECGIDRNPTQAA
jgi:two-component system cell cycle response regulator